MRKKHKWKVLFAGSIIFPSAVLLFGAPSQIQSKRAIFQWLNKEEPVKAKSKLTLFSWSSKEVTSNQAQLMNDLTEYNFDRVFQSFSSKLSMEEINSYISNATIRKIDVYVLTGSPKWALDPAGKSMIKRLDRIVAINKQLPEGQRIKGLAIDVEPYVLDNFSWDDRSIKESYVSGMKQLYAAAEKEGLELIVIVPYFFDTEGYEDVLETIIRNASTEVAIMNYYRNHEIRHLEFETRETKAANKPLTTIYEFKRPGEHDLTERNTYYHKGRLAAQENAEQLKEYYKDQEIHIAYHDYPAFRKVLDNE